MKLAIILGTRPEIIKMAPIVRACDKLGVEYFILHTGQHYDYILDKKIFEDLKLPQPKYNLEAGGKPYQIQIGHMIRKITEILAQEKPTAIIVQGDTNSVLAGALAANKSGIPIAHHEAGLRSRDLSMPEEINRILTDHISDFLFAPTEDALNNLREEGIEETKIFMSGNTVVDAVLQHSALATEKSRILEASSLTPGNYILATAHRAENVDSKEKLTNIFSGLDQIGKRLGLPVIFPIHPRTKNNAAKFCLAIPNGIKTIEPLGYLDFLRLEAGAKLIVTDSGGLQEETCILKIPCVTIRENTERPETLKAGSNILAGTDPEAMLRCTDEILSKTIAWTNPFGDGHAGERIVGMIKDLLAK